MMIFVVTCRRAQPCTPEIFALLSTSIRARHGLLSRCSFGRYVAGGRGFLRRRSSLSLTISCKNSKNSKNSGIFGLGGLAALRQKGAEGDACLGAVGIETLHPMYSLAARSNQQLVSKNSPSSLRQVS